MTKQVTHNNMTSQRSSQQRSSQRGGLARAQSSASLSSRASQPSRASQQASPARVARVGSMKITLAEKKKLEKRYLSLNRDLISMHEHGLDPGSLIEQAGELAKKLHLADELSTTAFNSCEAKSIGLDSSVVASISEIGVGLACLVEVDNPVFNMHKFAERLISKLNPNQQPADNEVQNLYSKQLTVSRLFTVDHMRRFGHTYGQLNHETPAYDFFYGSFDVYNVATWTALSPIVATERVHRERRKKLQLNTNPGSRTKPRTEQNENDNPDYVVSEKVGLLYREIKTGYARNNGQPISFFEKIVDPTSFGRTVTKIFHLAFLVKDGSISLQQDANGQPVVVPIRLNEANEKHRPNANSGLPRKQSVMSFNSTDWVKWLEQLKCGQP